MDTARCPTLRRTFFAVFIPVFVASFALLFVGFFRVIMPPERNATAFFLALAASFLPASAFAMFGCVTVAVIGASRAGVTIPWSMKLGTVLVIIYALTVCICFAFLFLNPISSKIIDWGFWIVVFIVIVAPALQMTTRLLSNRSRRSQPEGNDTYKPV